MWITKYNFFDIDWNELYRTKDNLEHAIVTVNDLDAFNYAMNNNSLTGDDKVAEMRKSGIKDCE